MSRERSMARVFKRRSDYEEKRFYAMPWGVLWTHGLTTDVDADNDDARSIESISTTATADNIPGPGRILDMYFYQPAGRRVERLLMRISIRFLHPSRILAFILRAHRRGTGDASVSLGSLSKETNEIHGIYNSGPTTVLGLQGLIRQAQSKNIYRSMAALTSLIHIVAHSRFIGFICAAAKVEPFVSHAAGLVGTLEDSKPEKKYFRALIRLTEATSVAYERGKKPDGFSRDVRGRLTRLVREYLSGQLDALDTAVETCYLLALNTSCLQFSKDQNWMESVVTLESVYFLLVFTSYLLDKLLFDLANCVPLHSHHARLPTSTLLNWLNGLLARLFWVIHDLRLDHTKLFQNVIPLYCISLTFTRKYGFTLHSLPKRWLYVNNEYLPRNTRVTGSCKRHHRPFVGSLLLMSEARTLRLLENIDELEREMRDINSLLGDEEPIPQEGSSDYRYGLSDEEVRRTLDLARRASAHVPRNSLTEGFHFGCEERRWPRHWVWGGWDLYKIRCRMRHAWGRYLCSILDWDWDLAGYLNRMYELPNEHVDPGPRSARSADSQYPDANKHVEAAPFIDLTHGILEAVVESPVTEVRIVYKSPTGVLSYRTFRDVTEAVDMEDSSETETQTTNHPECVLTKHANFQEGECTCDHGNFRLKGDEEYL